MEYNMKQILLSFARLYMYGLELYDIYSSVKYNAQCYNTNSQSSTIKQFGAAYNYTKGVWREEGMQLAMCTVYAS